MTKRILVTSALPYANGSIHLGHLVEYIQTDIFVRFLRLIGEDVIYCCADDTHGTPIEIAASQQGIKPEELIEKYYKEHTKDFNDFLISFDSYYSTNSKENKEFSDLFFNKLKEKKLIYTKEIEQSYCSKCKRFLPDRYIKGKCPKCGVEDQYGDVCEKCNAAYTTTDLVDPYCVICRSKPVRKKSMHYFFKLSSLSKELDKWLAGNKELQPEIVNYVKNWIKDGLQDWDISRDGPYFGFKIPGEENKYYYVWLDAPIGYIASTANYCAGRKLDAVKDYWKSKNCEIIHFIGKDIIYFHFLFWPAMLSSAGFNLPKSIVVHGHLTVNGEKMSKSRGTFITGREFLQKYNPEHLRFYYAKVLSKKMQDIDFSFKDFKDVVNNELAANIGNFCYRVLTFILSNFDGKVISVDKKAHNVFINNFNLYFENVYNNYKNVNFNEAVKEILAVSSLGNKFFQEAEPWKLIKEDKKKAWEVLSLCANICRNLAILVKPIMPLFSEQLEKQLNVKDLNWKDLGFDLGEHKIGKALILINKIEEEKLFPLDLRVAKIVKVGQHPNADKLYVLNVDLKNEKRQLVAGLKEHYKADELAGKKVIVVCNLEPAKLRGIESNGMLLAAEENGKVGILTTDAEVGSSVKLDGYENDKKQVSYKEFSKLKLHVKDGKFYFEDKLFKANGADVRAERIREGGVR